MKAVLPFIVVVALVLLVFACVSVAHGPRYLFGIIIPYAAVAVFVLGFIRRVVQWGKSPVPFCIPTTCGQQKTLPWIRHDRLENPATAMQVVGRMLLEVLVFRSLFRNLSAKMTDNGVIYKWEKLLWLAGLAFHWSFLFIFVRHYRFFVQDVPSAIRMMEGSDSYFQVGAPLFYVTDAVILCALTFLLFRRFYLPQVRYISLIADYFPLYLILGIVISGILMRHVFKVHVIGVKMLAMGLVTFSPTIPEGIGAIFYVHLFLICVLLMYFPFSKLMHMGGVFMSPTRNMANNSRMVRHINPWNYPVRLHTYEEYEDDFREKMKKAGLPVEKE